MKPKKKKMPTYNFHLYAGGTFIEDYETQCEAINAAEGLPALPDGYIVYDIAAESKWTGPRPGKPPVEE